MSKSVIGALRVNLGLDSAQFERGAKRANSSLTTMRNQFLGIVAVAKGLRLALTGMAMASMQTIDRQAKLARAVGGTTAGLQALERAADRSGVQHSELAAAATRLNQALGVAMINGKGTEGAFRRIGISAQQLANMDIDERFSAISDAMLKAGMSTQEMSASLRELGIRQSSVITLIQGGSEEIARSRKAVDDFGVSVSEVDAAQIERANDALSEVARVFEGLRNRLAVAVAPAIERTANAFTELARAGRPLGEAFRLLIGNLDRIGTYASVAVAAFGTRYVAALVAARLATFSLSGALVVLRGALIRTGIGALIVGAGELVYQFSRLVTATGGWGAAIELLGEVAAGVWEGIKTSASSIGPALKGVWKSIVAEFQFAMHDLIYAWGRFLAQFSGSLSRLGETEILGARPFAGAEAAAQALVRAAGDAYSAAGDRAALGNAADRAAREAFADAAATVTAGFDRAAEAGRRLADAVRDTGDETADTTAAIERINNALDDTERAGGGARSGLDDAREGMSGLNDAAQQLGQSIQSSMEQGFMAIFDGTKKASAAFRDMARQILAELYRVLVVQRLVGTFQAGGGGILGALAGAFGGARADGGPVSAGRSYLVGERGPEMIVPRSDAHVIPNHALGGGPVNQVFHFNLAANGDESVRRIVAQAAPQIVEAAKTGVLDARRRGGAYRAAFG
jgi:hypothetical protein